MTLFVALYRRRCSSPIGWFKTGKVKPLGTDLVMKDQEKVSFIQTKLLAAQSIQKKYIDHTLREMDFKIRDHIFLNVSPMKRVMMFDKRGKINPWYIGPLRFLRRWDQLRTGWFYYWGCWDPIQYFIFVCLKVTMWIETKSLSRTQFFWIKTCLKRRN